MKFQVLGIGNAFTACHYNTSFLVRAGHVYLIDGPQALFRLLKERGIDPADIDRLIVTHVHGDHSSGVETLLLWKRYVQGRRLTLYTSRAVYEEMESRFFPGFSRSFSPDLQHLVETQLDEYVDFVELHEETRNRVDEDLWIEIRHNWHPAATLGLKIGNSRHSVGVSGDTCYRLSLLNQLYQKGRLSRSRFEKLAGDWLWEADRIYHEVEPAEKTSHTREQDLLALPLEVRKRLRLVHVPDGYPEGKIPVAREGEIIDFS